MKPFNVLTIFLFFIFPLYSQASYTIDDFGTYIIIEKGIHKVPVIGDESQLSFFCFRGQYAIFGASNARGRISFYLLYDIENDIVSERLAYVYSKNINYLSIGIKAEKDNVLLRLGNVIYLLDSKSLSIKDNYNVDYYEFKDLIKKNEESFFQYDLLNKHSIRYYYGGDYKYFERDEVFFNPVFKDIDFDLENGKITTFSKKYRYVDIVYSEKLWETASQNDFDIETHISFRPELNGERAVINVYSYVLLGK